MKLAHRFVLAVALLLLGSGCADYGEPLQFDKITVHFKDGVTGEEARSLGEFIREDSALAEYEQTAVQIVKDDGAYVVRLAPPKGVKLDDEEFLSRMDLLKSNIAKMVFPGEYVRLQITDENCVPVQGITDYGRKLVSGEITLYYQDGVSEEVARRLVGELGGAEGVREHQVVMDGEACVLRFAIEDDAEIDDTLRDTYRALGGEIHEKALPDGTLKIELANGKFETREAIKDKDEAASDDS